MLEPKVHNDLAVVARTRVALHGHVLGWMDWLRQLHPPPPPSLPSSSAGTPCAPILSARRRDWACEGIWGLRASGEALGAGAGHRTRPESAAAQATAGTCKKHLSARRRSPSQPSQAASTALFVATAANAVNARVAGRPGAGARRRGSCDRSRRPALSCPHRARLVVAAPSSPCRRARIIDADVVIAAPSSPRVVPTPSRRCPRRPRAVVSAPPRPRGAVSAHSPLYPHPSSPRRCAVVVAPPFGAA